MTVINPPYRFQRPVHNIRTDIKPTQHQTPILIFYDNSHCSFLILLQEIIVQGIVTAIGSIIEPKSPRPGLHCRQIGSYTQILRRGRTLMPSPPAVRIRVRIAH
jgi:hypothetical protein